MDTIITNLLDKPIKFVMNDPGDEYHSAITLGTQGNICAIYHSAGIRFGIVTTDGKFVFNVSPASVVVCEDRTWEVFLQWQYDRKIHAIKVVREHQNIGLKEAKDFVESHPNVFAIKSELTYNEAQALAKNIELTNGLKCRVERMA